MKKTLITLLALTGVALGEDWTASLSSSNGTKDQTYTDYTAAFPDGSPLTLQITGMTITGTGNQINGSYDGTGTAVYKSYIRPNANVGNGGSYTITFALTNESESTISLKAITLDAFAYNSSGGVQSGDLQKREINFSLTGDVSSSMVHSFTNEGYTDDNNKAIVTTQKWDTNPELTLATPVTIEANGQITFNLTVTKSDSAGTFVGLSGATFSVSPIPEPATATLSLLALCGLAARRRRK